MQGLDPFQEIKATYSIPSTGGLLFFSLDKAV